MSNEKIPAPASVELFKFLERSHASLAKVLVIPLTPRLKLETVHPVRGFIGLLRSLRHRTPEQMIQDLGLLTVAERLSYGLFDAQTLISDRIPFGGTPIIGSIEGVNILRLTHLPAPIDVSVCRDARFPNGQPFQPGSGWNKDYWLPGSPLPQFKLEDWVQMHARVIAVVPSGKPYV